MLAESAERGKEKQRGEEQKKKKSIAIDMQHCIKTATAQREKGRDGELILHNSRALGKTEEDRRLEREMKVRVVIERKDLFDITREKERRGRFKEDCDKEGRGRKGHGMK